MYKKLNDFRQFKWILKDLDFEEKWKELLLFLIFSFYIFKYLKCKLYS